MQNRLLTITPAGIDTATATSVRWRNTIAAGIQGKTRTQVVIPTWLADNTTILVQQYMPYVYMQFNYTAPRAFVFTSMLNLEYINTGYIFYVVAFRQGNKKTRYVLPNNTIIPQFDTVAGATRYSGEMILPQFSIEAWAYTPLQQGDYITFQFPQMVLDTSILNLPQAVVPSSVALSPIGDALDLTALRTSLPKTLPYAWNPAIRWNDNV